MRQVLDSPKEICMNMWVKPAGRSAWVRMLGVLVTLTALVSVGYVQTPRISDKNIVDAYHSFIGRLYRSLAAYFDKSWKSEDIELVSTHSTTCLLVIDPPALAHWHT